MYERILVPTDGSRGTQRAVRHALELAETYEATLHVLSVVNTSAFDALESGSEMTDALEEAGGDAIEAIEKKANNRGIETVTTLRRGTPHREILAYSDEHDIDMIVMGTHGRSGLDRVMLGSVTERVVRGATVPVVTVRMDEEARVGTAEAAQTIAREAMYEEGYEKLEFADDPHRASGSWIVPVRTANAEFHVHVDAETEATRVARLSG